VILILGSHNDILASEVNRCSNVLNLPVQFVEENALFNTVQVAFERCGENLNGFVRINGCEIMFTHLSGVLVRLPHTWWPSSEFDLQDQMFVYHETTAAWFSLLSSLTCPMVNRFSLGWWVQDVNYLQLLRKRLATRLDLEITAPEPTGSYISRLIPTLPDNSSDLWCVYLVGEHIIPRSSQCYAVVSLLVQKASALTHWQEENGIVLCRLDFEHKQNIRLKHVEVFPLLDHERAALVAKITAATVEKIS